MNMRGETLLTSWIRRHSRAIALSCLIGMTPVMASCYGRFPVTKAIYSWNGDVSENKVVQSVLMWVLVIIPVYQLAMLGDAVIFNLVEFWTGDTLQIGMTQTEDGRTVTLAPSADGSQAVLTLREGEKVLAEHTFVKVGDNRFEVRDSEGRLAGAIVRAPGGDLQLTDAGGTVVRTINANQLQPVS